jgi:predicted nucleic acid-binding protein
MNYFFDSSAFIKLFHREKGTRTVIEIVKNADNKLWISQLAHVEYHSALMRRLRDGTIRRKDLDGAFAELDVGLSHFTTEPLTHGIINEAKRMILQWGEKYPIRSLDAIHLATFGYIAEDEWLFVSCDLHMCEIIKAAHWKCLNPLEQID